MTDLDFLDEFIFTPPNSPQHNPFMSPGTPSSFSSEVTPWFFNGSMPSTPVSIKSSILDEENFPPGPPAANLRLPVEKENFPPALPAPLIIKTNRIGKAAQNKRRVCEIDDDCDWRFIGMESLAREEDDHYLYPSWSTKPLVRAYKIRKSVDKKTNYPGVATEAANLLCAIEILKDPGFNKKLYSIIQSVAESGENEWETAKTFLQRYGLNERVKKNRAYEKWVVFYDSTAPFITKGRPMALDVRTKKSGDRRNLETRELRVTPLYITAYFKVAEEISRKSTN